MQNFQNLLRGALSLLATQVGLAQQLTLTPLEPSGIYRLGEQAGWTVSPAAGAALDGSYTYPVKRNNFDVIKTGHLDLSTGPATIEIASAEPVMLYLDLSPDSGVGESGRTGIDYATIALNDLHGGHIHGQLARPARPGRFPGTVIFQWASPPYPLQKSWVTDRDQSYFLQMYLADYRTVAYLASRPDWDYKTLIVMGTSMGGQQSLCVAGLNPRVTGLIVNEPFGADGNGPLHGRAAGYPNWNAEDSRIMHTAPYFDTVNCAAHIRVPSLVSMGFVDTTASPVGIWTAFNQIKAPKESVPMIDSPHNHVATPAEQLPYTRRSAEWLNLLAQGYKRLPAAGEPSPRTDPTSLLAHEQLLHKARSGRIDLYFLGDSITRRWGGDTTQNILWRLHRGNSTASIRGSSC